MNFDHTPDELALFTTLETTLGRQGAEHPMELAALLAPTGYPTLANGALPGAQERLAQWRPAAYRTLEYGLRIAAPLMTQYGTQAWHTTWAAPVQKGEKLATAAFETVQGEPDLTGKPHNGGYLVAGTKGGIPGADLADLILATGTVGGFPALFLIEKGAADVTLTKGALGLFTLTAHGATLSSSHVVLLEKGPDLSQQLSLLKHRIQTSEATGHAAAVFEQAKKAAKTRPEGGKPPIARQEVGFKLATMYTLLQTSRLMAANAASLMDDGEGDAAMASHCARVFCSDAAQEIVTWALDVMGEAGFETGGPADRLARIQALRVEGLSVGQSKEAIGDLLLKY